jgi:uncharacterized protein YndB with AHSA1/START domain
MKATLTKAPVATCEMLVRKPIAQVFEAFIDPKITTSFWFTRSSGRLEVGKPVKWQWEMYGTSTSVLPEVIEPDQRIVYEWDGYTGRTTVELTFSRCDDDATYVRISESGWTGEGDKLVQYAVESTQGFTWTLAGLKAFLEHGIRLNLVADKNPAKIVPAWHDRRVS